MADEKPKNMVEEVDKEEEDAEKDGASKRGGKVKRARGGGLDAAEEHKTSKISMRKRGGKVPGKMAMERPDRRARGGAMSDMNPYTSAGSVSMPDYESKSSIPNGAGSKGGDSSAYGSKRRPG